MVVERKNQEQKGITEPPALTKTKTKDLDKIYACILETLGFTHCFLSFNKPNCKAKSKNVSNARLQHVTSPKLLFSVPFHSYEQADKQITNGMKQEKQRCHLIYR